MPARIPDLSRGRDSRGDEALFVDARHVRPDGWSLDVDLGPEPVFVRVIRDSRETREHGWAQGRRIVQWG